MTIAINHSDTAFADDQEPDHEYSPQWQKWQQSPHRKSMLKASKENILGDFNGVSILINGIKTEFFTRNNDFWVRTEDTATTASEFKIEYTFGVAPLQQYLVKTQNGKYQVLPFSWDTRDAKAGGQRWFHVYGDNHIPANDRLHWSGPLQNWNGMCADCHSTGLKRNYDGDTDIFETSWTSINVSCASCHSKDDYSDFKPGTLDMGWSFIEGQNTAIWTGDKRNQDEIEICAACHSRRAPITDGFSADQKFLDQFMPTLIVAPEYFPDGQVREEDYVWGSFLQSKMYSKGVICSDCHDPHSLKLKADGNNLCSQCHLPEAFDTPGHHNHIEGSNGSQCVNCHMPETTFMQVDTRNDHSFRIPRPDLTRKTASPDACTTCHKTMTPDQAAATIENWFGKKNGISTHYGEIFNSVLNNEIGAEKDLRNLIQDQNIPAIIRASALTLLSRYADENTASIIRDNLNSEEPLIRFGAIRGANFLPDEQKKELISPLLDDGLRAIRIEAFNSVGNIHSENNVKDEYFKASQQSMWRGEGRYNLALIHQKNNDIERAIELYQGAQEIDPFFAASYINLADIYRAQGDEIETGRTLDRGLSLMPDDPALNFSKALHMVRLKQVPEALQYLNRAVNKAPENIQYAYVYAIALKDMGRTDEAISILEKTADINRNNVDINVMLMDLNRSIENWKEALIYAENLSKLSPNNPTINRIITDLKQKAGIFN